MSVEDSAIPRIETLAVEEAIALGREVGLLENLSELNVFRTLLKHPKLARMISDMLMMLLGEDSKLGHRLRELVIMRIGWVTACDYEWTQHWRVAPLFGVGEADMLACRDWQGADCLDAADKAVLAATDDILANGEISEETWALCCEHLTDGDAQLIELPMVISVWRLISQFAKSVKLQLEDGVESWQPDGVRPDGA